MNSHHASRTIHRHKRTFIAIKAALLAAPAGALGLVASSAQAFSDNTYPGIACIYHSGGVPTPYFGMLENRTTQTAVVNCPIELKEGANIDRVNVWVWNANTAATVTCTLHTVRLGTFGDAGPGFEFNTEEHSSVLINDWNELQFNGITGNPSYEVHSFVRCEIPPAQGNSYSRIGQYKTDDFSKY